MLACGAIGMETALRGVGDHEPPRRLSFRTIAIVLALVTCAVLLRAFLFLRFEQLAFDSDQAITGLMAKHLIEGRAFPLFFYGQTYLLGVESWVAAVFFWIAGPTVAALRASLLAWNVAFACLAILTLHRANGLDVRTAFVPLLIFLLPPPSVATQLMNAQGAIVEPYVYVAGLWLLRKRPLWFGALLAIGFRNREFVAYAAPALIGVEILSGEITRERCRDWLVAGVAFAAIWQAIEALKPFADLMGPGTHGRFLDAFPGSQLTNLTERFDFHAGALPERASRLGPQICEWFSGARQVGSVLPIAEHPWIGGVAAIFLTLATARLAMLIVRPSRTTEGWRSAVAARVTQANFALYLTGVGAVAIAVFVAGRPVLAGFSRYVLLGLAFPIGLIASLLVLEPIRLVRTVTAAILIAWAVLMTRDHVSLATSYMRNPEMNAHRIVADTLVSEGISTATAGYWNAYVITFYARERLKVTAQDFVRIEEYQHQFQDNITQAVAISDRPCPDDRLVGRFYICAP